MEGISSLRILQLVAKGTITPEQANIIFSPSHNASAPGCAPGCVPSESRTFVTEGNVWPDRRAQYFLKKDESAAPTTGAATVAAKQETAASTTGAATQAAKEEAATVAAKEEAAIGTLLEDRKPDYFDQQAKEWDNILAGGATSEANSDASSDGSSDASSDASSDGSSDASSDASHDESSCLEDDEASCPGDEASSAPAKHLRRVHPCGARQVLCDFWQGKVLDKQGRAILCKHGDSCRFAHGEEQLRRPFDPCDETCPKCFGDFEVAEPTKRVFWQDRTIVFGNCPQGVHHLKVSDLVDHLWDLAADVVGDEEFVESFLVCCKRKKNGDGYSNYTNGNINITFSTRAAMLDFVQQTQYYSRDLRWEGLVLSVRPFRKFCG
jgi:hypothetical protein